MLPESCRTWSATWRPCRQIPILLRLDCPVPRIGETAGGWEGKWHASRARRPAELWGRCRFVELRLADPGPGNDPALGNTCLRRTSLPCEWRSRLVPGTLWDPMARLASGTSAAV